MPASLSLVGTGHSSKEMLLPMAKSPMKHLNAVDKKLERGGGGPASKTKCREAILSEIGLHSGYNSFLLKHNGKLR